MKNFINKVLNSARKYSVFDFAIFKIYLLVLGILLGAYFANFFLNYTVFLWVIFIAAFLWIFYRTFFKHMD